MAEQDTTDYTVTRAAPPRVAGRPVKPGDTLALTESAALAEWLAGAIVAKVADAKPGEPPPDGIFETTSALADIWARALGLAGAEAVVIEPATEPAAGGEPAAATDTGTSKQAGSDGGGNATTSSDGAQTDAGSKDDGKDGGKTDGKADGAPADAGADASRRSGKTATSTAATSTAATAAGGTGA